MRGRPRRRIRARADHPDPCRARTHQDVHLGRAEPGSRRTRRRLARYRTGCEGRISHLKRGYGLRRSRLRGDQGQRIWTGWAVLAYNLDTLAIQAA
jgi:IS5 family transposase